MPSRTFSIRLRSLLLAGLFIVPAHTAPLCAGVAAQEPAAMAQTTASQRSALQRANPKRRPATTRRSRRARPRVAAAKPTPPRWTTPRTATALATDLTSMLAARVRRGQWGVHVVSLTRGDTLYSVNADLHLQPASNMKLFTAALALNELGPDHRFSTDVLRYGTLTPDGILLGDLILRGDGDPAFSGRFLDGGPGAPVNALAQLVADAGVRRVRGGLIADATAFDQQRIPEGWQERYLASSYAARVSALSLNENLVWIVIRPTSRNRLALVSLDPAADVPVRSAVRTLAGSRSARVLVRANKDGSIEARGWIGSLAGEQRYSLVVEDPAAFTASAFRRALAARGITVEGSTRFGATPTAAERIAALASPPLSRLLSVMNRESVNHYAELIFRNAARTAARDRVGSQQSGSQLLTDFMTTKVGATPGSFHAADGSGLSILDRATPAALVQLLAYAHRAPWADAFHASLPVAGESELLRNRMKLTPAQGNLHAKTGTTNTVISLGGYVTAQDGELLAFAFIYNGTDRWNARTTIDEMGATLASFVRH